MTRRIRWALLLALLILGESYTVTHPVQVVQAVRGIATSLDPRTVRADQKKALTREQQLASVYGAVGSTSGYYASTSGAGVLAASDAREVGQVQALALAVPRHTVILPPLEIGVRDITPENTQSSPAEPAMPTLQEKGVPAQHPQTPSVPIPAPPYTVDGLMLEPFVIENMGATANLSGTKSWRVKNDGSLPGRLFLRIQNLQNLENGCNDQERAVDPACTTPGKQGDLGRIIVLKIALDGTDVAAVTLATGAEAKLAADWSALTPIIVAVGDERTITAHWSLGENAYGNEVQSDSVQFDMSFALEQLPEGLP